MAAHIAKSRTCLGCIPIETGVLIITIFGILNKLSGFYGLISLDTSDVFAFVIYIYSLLSIIVFAQGLYSIHTENVRIVRWYVLYYWFDCVVSAITTSIFAVKWYVYTDHSLPELAGDPVKQKEHDDVFRMEAIVSVVMLVVLYLVHIYFAVVLTIYYRSLGHQQYAKLAASVDEDLEELEYTQRPAKRNQL